MELSGLDKEIEMPLPTTSGCNPSNRDSSSSPTLASTVGETSSDQPLQTSDHYHPHHPPSLPSNPLQQFQRNTRDPDPPSVTAITPIASRSNPRPATGTTVRYRECLKNHAASMGGHIVDGCGEFMPSGEGTPQSLICAACDCHRNFHRKETEGELQTNVLNYYACPPCKSNNAQRGPFPPFMMAFGGGSGAAESSSEDLNMFQYNDAGGQGSVQPVPSSKKRFRTKFSQQQKDRMMEFAEKLGWRIQKHDEQEVQQFCNQVGVKRQVFKVWIHNNKQAMKKHQIFDGS
ncbi:zinc-finger homeodomain protein 6-like isoform X2 [Prosopis cineraria]|uniref:zinc-finger homeodomain protein 6-like isoform X2 n=1 Tax=Prosopis cineraria TaxID=364024 RepID=UPI00240F9B63|nr:zinc-finger homeodomain protein 6-like isoform X2 [Prosopis cineraria]